MLKLFLANSRILKKEPKNFLFCFLKNSFFKYEIELCQISSVGTVSCSVLRIRTIFVQFQTVLCGCKSLSVSVGKFWLYLNHNPKKVRIRIRIRIQTLPLNKFYFWNIVDTRYRKQQLFSNAKLLFLVGRVPEQKWKQREALFFWKFRVKILVFRIRIRIRTKNV
jgi:hypothetical protein